MVGDIEDSLYKFSSNLYLGKSDYSHTSSQPCSYINNIKSKTIVNVVLWHERFGPSRHQVVNLILKGIDLTPTKIITNDLYSAFQMSKSYRLNTSNIQSCSLHPFDIIHVDISRPSFIVSSSGIKYIILFVDNFTRYYWIYVMHHKSLVAQIF